MSAIHKQAAFNLTVVAVTFGLFFASAPVLGIARAGGMFGLLGILGFGLLFYRRRNADAVVTDERDRAIQQRAGNIAFAAFWCFFVAACVSAYLVYGPAGAMPIRNLPIVMYFAWGLWEATRAIVVLLLYRQQMESI